VAGYAVRRLEDVPQIPPEDDEDFEWYPLQHYFRLTAFGANVYRATAAGGDLIAAHDESGSNQEELYVVIAGEAAFTIDGDSVDVPAVGVVAIPDPAVKREAVAKTAGTTVIVIGAAAQPAFRSSWQAKWFEHVPQVEG
jgi:hypothetical protein